MLLACPFCGPREHSEFSYGGDATVRRPHQNEPVWGSEWQSYVYERANPRGPHKEYWQHAMGCRQWLIGTRDTLSHEVTECVPAEQTAGIGP